MASPNIAPLSLCLALAVLSATMAHVATAAPHRRLQKLPVPRFDDDDDPKGEPSIVPPPAGACWKSILASESCVDDLLHSLAELRVRLSRACCSALERIGDRCVVDAFSGFPFDPTYPPLVKRVCGLAV